ncbi:ankyrin repeat domain-containing protein [Rhizobacter sp. OV335]|uniref:ankyrin repeat domain-containing protein n=1 Tax=Rhizobacter sp. OV335 TaxID=1500264 RepID=UPI0009131734|nr:ankyrin repeat domain-containing protein [Rhizobacter sp. OV335]SHN16500.1 Ankyrin repeat-containing protein [Rhizobacter sp. OV335]
MQPSIRPLHTPARPPTGPTGVHGTPTSKEGGTTAADWRKHLELQRGLPPFDLVPRGDTWVDIGVRDEFGSPFALNWDAGRSLLRRFYACKASTDMRLAERDGKPLTASDFVRQLTRVLHELQEEANQTQTPDLRVTYDCATESEHFVPISCVLVEGRWHVIVADSLEMSEPLKDALKQAASELPPTVQLHVVEAAGMASHGCREQTLLFGRRLTARDPSGEPLISAASLFEESRNPKSKRFPGALTMHLPDRLRFYAERPGLRNTDREVGQPVVHQRKNADGARHGETLEQWFVRHSPGRRMEYLRLKGLRLAVRVRIQHYLEKLDANPGSRWPDAAKRSFIVEAKKVLRSSARNHVARKDLDNLHLDLDAVDAWLAESGVVTWSAQVLRQTDGSGGTSLLSQVRDHGSVWSQSRVLRHCMPMLMQLTSDERVSLLSMALNCEDDACLADVLAAMAEQHEISAALGRLDALQPGYDLGRNNLLSALSHVAAAGLAETVSRLLQLGIDPKGDVATAELQKTLLAQRANAEAVAERLVQGGARWSDWLLALWSSGQGDTPAAKWLEQRPREVDGGRTPFMLAAGAGNLEKLRALHTDRTLKDVTDSDCNALTYAAASGHVESCKQLLEWGADPSRHALSQAARNGHPAVVELLLGHSGIDIDQVDPLGNRPAIAALLAGHVNVAKILTNAGADLAGALGRPAATDGRMEMRMDVFRSAINHDRVDVIRALAEMDGFAADYVDPWGRTPLFYAAMTPSLRSARALLELGANRDHSDNGGKTALQYARGTEMTSLLTTYQRM